MREMVSLPDHPLYREGTSNHLHFSSPTAQRRPGAPAAPRTRLLPPAKALRVITTGSRPRNRNHPPSNPAESDWNHFEARSLLLSYKPLPSSAGAFHRAKLEK